MTKQAAKWIVKVGELYVSKASFTKRIGWTDKWELHNLTPKLQYARTFSHPSHAKSVLECEGTKLYRVEMVLHEEN